MVSRVTQNTVNRMYNRNFSNNLGAMTDLMDKVAAKRKFTRASENPISAARALAVRKSMSNVDTYQANLSTAKGIFQTAESILREDISAQAKNVIKRVETAVQTTYSQQELDIMGHELRSVADGLVKSMNSDYADRNIFAGTNNSDVPFKTTTDASGKTVVTYNGVDVNSSDDPTTFPSSEPILSDIGLGLQYDTNGDVIPDTAMDISLNGAELTGCGTQDYVSQKDGNTYNLSNNFIQLVYDAADACESGDTAKLNAMLDALGSSHSTMLMGITNIGIQESTIEYNETKFEEYEYNLSASQLELEGMSEEDLAKAITEYKSMDAAYSAVLSMSSKVIPNSIWDFL